MDSEDERYYARQSLFLLFFCYPFHYQQANYIHHIARKFGRELIKFVNLGGLPLQPVKLRSTNIPYLHIHIHIAIPYQTAKFNSANISGYTVFAPPLEAWPSPEINSVTCSHYIN